MVIDLFNTYQHTHAKNMNKLSLLSDMRLLTEQIFSRFMNDEVIAHVIEDRPGVRSRTVSDQMDIELKRDIRFYYNNNMFVDSLCPLFLDLFILKFIIIVWPISFFLIAAIARVTKRCRPLSLFRASDDQQSVGFPTLRTHVDSHVVFRANSYFCSVFISDSSEGCLLTFFRVIYLPMALLFTEREKNSAYVNISGEIFHIFCRREREKACSRVFVFIWNGYLTASTINFIYLFIFSLFSFIFIVQFKRHDRESRTCTVHTLSAGEKWQKKVWQWKSEKLKSQRERHTCKCDVIEEEGDGIASLFIRSKRTTMCTSLVPYQTVSGYIRWSPMHFSAFNSFFSPLLRSHCTNIDKCNLII